MKLLLLLLISGAALGQSFTEISLEDFRNRDLGSGKSYESTYLRTDTIKGWVTVYDYDKTKPAKAYPALKISEVYSETFELKEPLRMTYDKNGVGHMTLEMRMPERVTKETYKLIKIYTKENVNLFWGYTFKNDTRL